MSHRESASIVSLRQRVDGIVAETPVLDLHTHLYDPGFRSLLLRGIDDLLVYHYLVSESFRQMEVPYDRFWAASKSEQADLIWDALFVKHSPVSEACAGVLTVLNAFGLEPRQRDLKSLRAWFAALPAGEHVERVLKAANVSAVGMTNSPFDDEERPYWDPSIARDPRFFAALRIDPLILSWTTAVPFLRGQGYEVTADRSARTVSEVRRFLADWTRRIGSRYCMVSLPPDFRYPADTDTNWLLDQAVLPHCREFNQPFALMMGVRRAVNPSLRMAGDGVGRSDLNALRDLCAGSPENRFLATVLSRENLHELVVLARKFRNLHPFGCWWFTNTPQLVEEITRMRLELLGMSFTPQHSDSRVLDQLIYKWRHTRGVVAGALSERYAALAGSGWLVTDDEIRRDATELFGGAFERFCRG
jgi:hypothetical protein